MVKIAQVKLLLIPAVIALFICDMAYAGVSKEVKFTQSRIHTLVQDYIEQNMPWSKDAVRF